MVDRHTRPTILLVEDDAALAEGIGYALTTSGFQILHAPNASAARAMVHTTPPDLAIVDVGLPDGDGFQLVPELFAPGVVPVIFLTARDEEVHVVRGLDLGADDYISKTVSIE